VQICDEKKNENDVQQSEKKKVSTSR